MDISFPLAESDTDALVRLRDCQTEMHKDWSDRHNCINLV